MPTKPNLPRWVRLWQLRAQRRARSEVVDIWRRAAMVGGALLLGFVALAFAKAGDEAQKLIFHISHRAWWLPILVTPARSEEHTSELQSLMRNSYAVFCLKK